MKIIYIAELNLKETLAPKIHVEEIVGNLKTRKHDISLIIPNTGKFTDNFNLKPLVIGFRNFPSYFNYLFLEIFLLFYLPYIFIFKKIDLVYTRQGLITLIPSLICKLFKICYFTEVNGNYKEEMSQANFSKFLQKIVGFVEKRCYFYASRIIVATPQLKNYLIRKYGIGKSKIIIIEHGVDSNQFIIKNKSVCKIELGLNKRNNYLCFVGGFFPWQGIENIINSFAAVSKKYNNLQLLIVGDGILKKELIQLTNTLHLMEKVIFTGKVDHKIVVDYIGASKICLAPFTRSRNQLAGNSAFKIYEYASCGRPIISTSPNFIIPYKCGLVVEPENPKALTAAIIKLLNNPKLAKKMGENARNAILNGYSWKSVAERLELLIKETINDSVKNV